MKTRYQHRLVALSLFSLPALSALSVHTGCGLQTQQEDEVSMEKEPLHESALACDRNAYFGAPTRVSVGPQRDGGTRVIPGPMTSARLSPDESTIFVDTGYQNDVSKDGWDVVTGKRSSNTTFGQATWLQGVNSPRADKWPSVSADGLTLVFASDRAQAGTSRIFISQRTSASANFGIPQEIVGLPSGSLDSPFLVGNELWFQTANGNGDIYRSTLSIGGVAGPATPVTDFNTEPTTEIAPVVTPDGLVAFWATTRVFTDGGSAPPTSGSNLDIWTAVRSSTDVPFGWRHPVSTIDNVADKVNGAADEWPTWVSPDGCRLYFVSRREGTQFIYVASR